jgi:hypothetical protein
MPLPGDIAERTRGLLPVTWDALEGDERYGLGLLAAALEIAREASMGVQSSEAEEDTLPRIVVDYVAKLAAIEIIPAGIDYWMSQTISVVTTGTNESETYTDRAAMLRELRNDLLAETRAKADDMAKLIGYWPPSTMVARPALNTASDLLLTPSPQEFPRPFTQTSFS